MFSDKSTALKVSKYRVLSGPHFPVFGLNTEIYGVTLCIQSEYRKIRTRKTPYLDTFHAVKWLTEMYHEDIDQIQKQSPGGVL